MSNNTILSGIKRMGYAGKQTGHGFRALAMTTLMEELGYTHEIPDTQLAHAKGDNTRRAYDRTKYLPQRKVMMQKWADYLDKICTQKSKAVKFQSKGGWLAPFTLLFIVRQRRHIFIYS